MVSKQPQYDRLKEVCNGLADVLYYYFVKNVYYVMYVIYSTVKLQILINFLNLNYHNTV